MRIVHHTFPIVFLYICVYNVLFIHFEGSNKTLKKQSYKMVHCQACGVTDKARHYGITFHRFPKSESQRNAWISFINKDNGSNADVNCTMLCSQHFEESCFDKTSKVKIRLKPNSVPTIHISRAKYSKYEDFFTKVPTTVSSKNKTTVVNIIYLPDMSIDAPTMASNINNKTVKRSLLLKNYETSVANISNISADTTAICSDIKSKIIEKSIDSEVNDFSPKNTSDDEKLNDIASNNVESLPINIETNALYKISPSDTPEEIVLKERIVSMKRSLAEKSTLIRNLQKKNSKQQKRISKLRLIISELKKFTSSGNTYTLINKFGQTINRKDI